MVQQSGAYTVARHLVGDLFEVAVFDIQWKGKAYTVNPVAKTCSCGKADCHHLADAAEFLHDHHCPNCGHFYPLRMVCGPCAYLLAIERRGERVA